MPHEMLYYGQRFQLKNKHSFSFPLSCQLFVVYGNKAANDVWGYNIPAAEQILPDAATAEREAFIRDKYVKGIYRRSHPLASNRDLLEQVRK